MIKSRFAKTNAIADLYLYQTLFMQPIQPIQPIQTIQHVQFESWMCPLSSGSKIDGSYLEFCLVYVPEESFCFFLGDCWHVTCFLSTGFTGYLCQTNIDDCAPQPCQNGRTCVDKVNSFSCLCPAGTAVQ